MYVIALLNMVIENFKGIKSFETPFNGSTIINGENGSGKTTIKDAFFWLGYDKDSSGRTDFEIHPLDADNNAIKGLVTKVQCHIRFGDKVHILRKELHERCVKKQLKGYTTKCWIDEVAMSITQYNNWIQEKIAEDSFKLLTDTHYFNSDKMKHKKETAQTRRRKVLISLIKEPSDIYDELSDQFPDLVDAIDGRGIDNYRKILTDRKKLYETERDDNIIKIGENQQQLDDYAGGDTTDQEKVKKAIEDELTAFAILREEIVIGQNARQVKIDEMNQLQGKRTEREGGLKNDTTAVDNFITERTQIKESVEKKKNEIMEKQSAIRDKKKDIEAVNGAIKTAQETLSLIRTKAKGLQSLKESDTACVTCHRPLEADQIKELEAENKLLLKGVIKDGDATYRNIEAFKKDIASLTEELKDLQGQLSILEKEIEDGIKYRDERLVIIEKSIAANVTIDPAHDPTCVDLSKEILRLAGEIGEPAGNQLATIEENRRVKSGELAEVEKALAASGQMKKNTKRIKELEDREKVLAQDIADIEKETDDIDQYKKAESGLIESAVNDKFKHVTFKLFNMLLNGSTEDCCEAILNGTPYPGMSCGEKNFVGIDIINVLSEHYKLSVPLFIDNAESMTLPIEAKSQVIELHAVPGVKKLTIQEVNVKAVA